KFCTHNTEFCVILQYFQSRSTGGGFTGRSDCGLPCLKYVTSIALAFVLEAEDLNAYAWSVALKPQRDLEQRLVYLLWQSVPLQGRWFLKLRQHERQDGKVAY